MRTSRVFLLTATLVAVALAGCTTSESGSASVYVKDAPTDDFAEIHVAFTKVEVHAASGDDNATEDGNGTSSAGWITLFENATAQDVDLLDASGDRAFFLGEAELDAGRYTQIRVHATEAYGIGHDGNRTDFELANTPLKVVKSFVVEAGMETRIVLDFDLDRSIKTVGKDGYRMIPVIGKTTTEVVEDAESGEDVSEEGEVEEGVVEA